MIHPMGKRRKLKTYTIPFSKLFIRIAPSIFPTSHRMDFILKFSDPFIRTKYTCKRSKANSLSCDTVESKVVDVYLYLNE